MDLRSCSSLLTTGTADADATGRPVGVSRAAASAGDRYRSRRRAVKKARAGHGSAAAAAKKAAVAARKAPPGMKGPVLRDDGGEACAPRNTDTLLTFAVPGQVPLLATRDPFDRAHGQHDHSDRHAGLMPACCCTPRGRPLGRPLPGSVPRLYPRCCMTGAGVSHDSAAEALAEMQARLEGVSGIGRAVKAGAISPVAAATAATLAGIAARAGEVVVRRIVRGGPMAAEGDGRELELHKKATAMLRAAGAGEWG